MAILELYDITPDHIMTDKELTVIAETKGIEDVSSFDQIDIQWPGHQEWKVEVLEVLVRAQREEDEQLAELKKQRQEKEVEKERVRLEREVKMECKWLEKEMQDQQKPKEQAQRETQQAKDKEEYDRRLAE